MYYNYFFFLGFVMICMIRDELIYFFFIYCFICEKFGFSEFIYVIGIDDECVLINVFVVGFRNVVFLFCYIYS